MFKPTLSCSQAEQANKKSCQPVFRASKQWLVVTVLFALLSVSFTAFAAPVFVVLAADKDAPGISSLPQQLSNWRHSNVNSELGKQLAKTDKTFSMYKETKLNIRDKTLTTKTSWVELPPPNLAK